MTRLLGAALVSLVAAGCGGGHDHSTHDHGSQGATKPAGQETADLKEITPTAGYPLETCVVSGEDLGAMGERSAWSYKGTEVQFCCADCVDEFKKDPEKYLAHVRAARK
jgi:YHS domain-containing protein